MDKDTLHQNGAQAGEPEKTEERAARPAAGVAPAAPPGAESPAISPPGAQAPPGIDAPSPDSTPASTMTAADAKNPASARTPASPQPPPGAESPPTPPSGPDTGPPVPPGAEAPQPAPFPPAAGDPGAADLAEEDNKVGCPEEAQNTDFSHPADVAAHLEKLSLQEQVCLVRALPVEEAAEALAELDEHIRVELLENLDPDTAAGIVGEMSPDDAADVLDELDEDHSDVLLSKLQSEDAAEIRNLMAFDPETAGGVMNIEIIILSMDITADMAIRQIRTEIEDKENPYYAYIVNEGDVLVGVLSLRDLLLCPPGMPLSQALEDQDLITVTFDTGREEVARVIGHYNLMALPVVDYEGRLLGVISHDDVIDIMQELASEDMLGMVGAGQDESTDTPWLDSVKMRLPWLLVNMFNSALSAGVVYLFDGSIAQMAILAVFMPMVANQAGNTGQQALAVIIRQMATERFSRAQAWGAVVREGKIAAANGIILGLLVWLAVYLFTGRADLTCVMVASLMLDMVLGAFAGASIPVLLREMGRDPAQASSIFLTAITDGAGFFLFLGLATIFLL